MHSFTYNGINSRTYCELYVSGGGTFNAPERDIESIPVPGRDGELTVDNGRFKNITVEYDAWIANDFAHNAAKARAWLCSQRGYKRLEDDYNPYEYRMARFVGGVEFEAFISNGDFLAGSTTLKFDCMPQRFLKSGEEEITSNNSPIHIINPTFFDSQPIVTITGSGSGTLTINSNAIAISDIDGYVTLNTNIQRAYKGTIAKDSTITGAYPIFTPGENSVEFSGGITGVSIIPRWWTV